MKMTITAYHPVAVWKWDTSTDPHKLYHHAQRSGTAAAGGYDDEDEDEDDVCGICRLAFESCCPECKVPGDDCPLIWGECTHVFHMHCLLKWVDTESSKGQCPMDRRPWATADRKPDRLPTTADGAPVASVAPGPLTRDDESFNDDVELVEGEEYSGGEEDEADGDEIEYDE